jgi:hypothetical protein
MTTITRLGGSALFAAAAVATAWVWQAGAAGVESGFVAIDPCRLLDTREGEPLGPDSTIGQPVAPCGVPASATAVSVNVTGINASAPTFITLWGSGALPGTSTLNLVPDDPANPNGAIVPVSQGAIQVYNRFGTADVIVDVSGYFIGLGPPPPTSTTAPTSTTVAASSTTTTAASSSTTSTTEVPGSTDPPTSV